MLVVSPRVSIPLREFDFTFARSGGPGGQNVNKVNTKVTMRWNVDRSRSLPADMMERFRSRYHRRITNDGDFVMHSQRFRDQGRNVADCLDKLREMILEIATPPTTRKPTRPSRRSKQRRLDAKRRQSDKKRGRRRPTRDD